MLDRGASYTDISIPCSCVPVYPYQLSHLHPEEEGDFPARAGLFSSPLRLLV